MSQYRHRFSFYWTEALGKAVLQEATRLGKPYPMSISGAERDKLAAIVNQGIDAHLEACYIPDRGDSYKYAKEEGIRGRLRGTTLECSVSPESLVVLVRRLMEDESDEAQSLAGSICETLEIELI